MSFLKVYAEGLANGHRVAMSRRVLGASKQELYRVLHECRPRAELPDDVCWLAAAYAAGFQCGWDRGWSAAGYILEAHNDGRAVSW